MSETENNICGQCGGVKRIEYTIGFENGMPRDMRVEPQDLPQTTWRLCPGHPEPATKHDGQLDNKGLHVVITGNQVVVVDAAFDGYGLLAESFLSLLDWGEQNREHIKRMIKEQSGE